MLEIERRRLALGISMEEVSDAAGVADRYFAKILHSDSPRGRQAQWSTIQELVDALFPEGVDIELRPKKGLRLEPEDLRCKIRFAAAPKDPRTHRELMRELGKKGAEAFKRLSPEQRSESARKAAATRKANREQADAARRVPCVADEQVAASSSAL
ncbi:hypothetical protein CO683_14755 [Bradyrhizobium ottawaense]|nr:hypothetical protein CO683_14755 [Bradyrhizobium ottawaense]